LEHPSRPRDVCPGVNRELEAITLRAIALRPKQRYQSAEQFNDDLQRFLERRYVLAMGPGWPYRIRKAVARYAAPLVVLVFFLSLCGIALAVKWEADRMMQEASERLGQFFQVAPEQRSTLLVIADTYVEMGVLYAQLGDLQRSADCREYAQQLRAWVASEGKSAVPPIRPTFAPVAAPPSPE
jgi:hypothetical protein